MDNSQEALDLRCGAKANFGSDSNNFIVGFDSCIIDRGVYARKLVERLIRKADLLRRWSLSVSSSYSLIFCSLPNIFSKNTCWIRAPVVGCPSSAPATTPTASPPFKQAVTA